MKLPRNSARNLKILFSRLYLEKKIPDFFMDFSRIKNFFQPRHLKIKFLHFLLNFKAISLKKKFCCTKIRKKMSADFSCLFTFFKNMVFSFFISNFEIIFIKKAEQFPGKKKLLTIFLRHPVIVRSPFRGLIYDWCTYL